MASGFLDPSSVDLDSRFAPYTSGTKRPATGFMVGGQDLADRYQLGNAGIVTGFVIAAGTDLGNLFAAAGAGSPLAAGVSPTSLYRLRTTAGTATTTAATCTPTGGTPGYTYSWVRVSGSASIVANTPTASSSTFSGNVSAGTPTLSAVFRCDVTDAASTVVSSNTVSVTVEYNPA